MARAAALAIGLTRGGSTHVSWTPTDSRKPIRVVNTVQAHTYTFAQAVKAGVESSLKEQEQESGLPLCGTKPPTSGKAREAYEKTVARNDGDTCMADPRGTTTSTESGNIQSFFAVGSTSNGDGMLRYVDSDGWAIVYPRAFHGIGYSTQDGFAALGEEGTSFANLTPVPTPDAMPPMPADGVSIEITTTWNHVSGRARLGHESRFPLHLPASFHTHSTGSMQATDFDFQGNGFAYHASVIAGPKTSRADLEALERMIASISFPPAGGAHASVLRSRRGS